MGEKRGDIGKLKYDFETTAVCEVEMEENKWYRVTAKTFRSFDGPRRLTFPLQQPGIGMRNSQDLEFITEEYFGPVYMMGTNLQVPFTNSRQTVNNPDSNHVTRDRI